MNNNTTRLKAIDAVMATVPGRGLVIMSRIEERRILDRKSRKSIHRAFWVEPRQLGRPARRKMGVGSE